MLSIKGIGPKTFQKLKRAGVETIEDLKNANIEDLARKTGISTKRLKKFIAQVE